MGSGWLLLIALTPLLQGIAAWLAYALTRPVCRH